MSGDNGAEATGTSYFRRLLERERERYEAIVRERAEAGLAEPMSESTGDLSSYDQHPADAGNEMFERERDLGLRERALEVLERIDAALASLDAGEYGVCRSCGRPIGAARLRAIPFAEECVACACENEEEYHRPVEEEVVNFAESFSDSGAEVAYDAEDAWQDVARYGTANSPQDVPGDLERWEEYLENLDYLGDLEEFGEADHSIGTEAADLERMMSELDEEAEEARERARDEWRR